MSDIRMELAAPTPPKPKGSIRPCRKGVRAPPKSTAVKKGVRGGPDNGKHNFKGVRQRPNGKYCAEIRVQVNNRRIRIWLGTFISAEAASVAYNDAYIKYHRNDEGSRPQSSRGSAASSGVDDGGARSEVDTAELLGSFLGLRDTFLGGGGPAEVQEEAPPAPIRQEMPWWDPATTATAATAAAPGSGEREHEWPGFAPVDDIEWHCLQPDAALGFLFSAYDVQGAPFALPDLEMGLLELPPVHDQAVPWLSTPPAMGFWDQFDPIGD